MQDLHIQTKQQLYLPHPRMHLKQKIIFTCYKNTVYSTAENKINSEKAINYIAQLSKRELFITGMSQLTEMIKNRY